MCEAFRYVMNDVSGLQNGSFFQIILFILITGWCTKDSLAMIHIQFVRKRQYPTAPTMQNLFRFKQNNLVVSVNTLTLVFRHTTSVSPFWGHFALDGQDLLILETEWCQSPQSWAQKWIQQICVSLVLLTQVLLSRRAVWKRCLSIWTVLACKLVYTTTYYGLQSNRFSWRFSSMQPLTLGRRFSVQILPASSDYKEQGIIIGIYEEFVWLAFCPPVLNVTLRDIII